MWTAEKDDVVWYAKVGPSVFARLIAEEEPIEIKDLLVVLEEEDRGLCAELMEELTGLSADLRRESAENERAL